jgi:hypothetical protein
VGEELDPAEKELIEEAATRVLRGESLRRITMDWNERCVKTVGGGTWQGSMIRRVLMSPRIAGLKEHRGEIVGEAKWPAIIDRAKHDRLVGLLVGDESRRPANHGKPRVHPLAGLLYCGSCGGPLVTYSSPGSEAAMPELPDPSLAWEDLSAVDRRALTEMLVDKIIIEWHPSKIDNDGKKH